MTKTEFKNGELVRISGFAYKCKNDNGEFDYFVDVYDRNGDKYTMQIKDPTRIYQIDETNVMPISYFSGEGNAVFYPLKDFNRPHSMKFFVNGRFLEPVESDWPEDEDWEDDDSDDEFDDDDDFDEEDDGEENWNEVQEFAKISKNISNITTELQNVIDSLTKIINNRTK